METNPKAGPAGALLTTALFLFLAPAPPRAETIDLLYHDNVVIYGPERGCRLGEGVTGGDFDGDGIEDLLVGAPWADGPNGERKDCGLVLLFFGSPDRRGLSGPLDPSEAELSIYGTGSRDELGRRLASTDVDGDGRDDLVVGTMYADGPGGGRRDCGEAYVFFGRPRDEFPERIDLAESAADLTVSGAGEKDFLTGEMTVGDVNGDGLGDLILGAFYGDGPRNDRYHAGEVALVFGRPRASLPARIDLESDPVPILYGAEATDTFGRALAAGDIDGDGRDEVLVGAYYGDGPDNTRINGGETYVFFGRDEEDFPRATDLADGAELVIYGERDGDVSGRALASADMDGDGRDDILISAHMAAADFDADPRGNNGQVLVVYGADRKRFPPTLDLREDADCRLVGAGAMDNLGWPVVTGDWNGDGREDLLVAAKHSDGGDLQRREAGEVYLVRGWERGARFESMSIREASAITIVGAGEQDLIAFDAVLVDWDGDGRREICIGAPQAKGADNLSPQTGEVHVVFAPPE